MSRCSSVAVPTGFGTGVGVRPAVWQPGQGCVWILARAPQGQRSQKAEHRERVAHAFWARGVSGAHSPRPLSCRFRFGVSQGAEVVPGRVGGLLRSSRNKDQKLNRRRKAEAALRSPPSRAPSSRPLLFIGNTPGAARALWWQLPAKGLCGHAFRHSQSRVLILVSTTHCCLISPPHPLPAVPTPQDSREHLDSGLWEMTGRQGVGTMQ